MFVTGRSEVSEVEQIEFLTWTEMLEACRPPWSMLGGASKLMAACRTNVDGTCGRIELSLGYGLLEARRLKPHRRLRSPSPRFALRPPTLAMPG
jgi:hypothetical protein